MTKTATKTTGFRPATQLRQELEAWIRPINHDGPALDMSTVVCSVPGLQIQKWFKFAKSIDARMRLDGSKLNKRKSLGAGRKRVTR